MSVLIVLALLIALDVAAWFTGHDSRDGRDWSFRGWKVMTAARAMEKGRRSGSCFHEGRPGRGPHARGHRGSPPGLAPRTGSRRPRAHDYSLQERAREGSCRGTPSRGSASAVGPHRQDAHAQQPDLDVVVAIALCGLDRSDALPAARPRCERRHECACHCGTACSGSSRDRCQPARKLRELVMHARAAAIQVQGAKEEGARRSDRNDGDRRVQRRRGWRGALPRGHPAACAAHPTQAIWELRAWVICFCSFSPGTCSGTSSRNRLAGVQQGVELVGRSRPRPHLPSDAGRARPARVARLACGVVPGDLGSHPRIRRPEMAHEAPARLHGQQELRHGVLWSDRHRSGTPPQHPGNRLLLVVTLRLVLEPKGGGSTAAARVVETRRGANVPIDRLRHALGPMRRCAA
jgi:hypothetical protein